MSDIIAWVGCSCRWCGWKGKVEVKERDQKGKMLIRCPGCGERIDIGE